MPVNVMLNHNYVMAEGGTGVRALLAAHMYPVSYTHLDVYKRQVIRYILERHFPVFSLQKGKIWHGGC